MSQLEREIAEHPDCILGRDRETGERVWIPIASMPTCHIATSVRAISRICQLPGCGRPILKGPTEGSGRFAVRSFCSRECAIIANRHAPGTCMSKAAITYGPPTIADLGWGRASELMLYAEQLDRSHQPYQAPRDAAWAALQALRDMGEPAGLHRNAYSTLWNEGKSDCISPKPTRRSQATA